MDTTSQTAPEVKPALVPSPRRVRVLTLNYTDIALPADISDNKVGEIIAILDRSTVLEANYGDTAYDYIEAGAPRVTLSSEARTIYPDRAALEAARAASTQPNPYAAVHSATPVIEVKEVAS